VGLFYVFDLGWVRFPTAAQPHDGGRSDAVHGDSQGVTRHLETTGWCHAVDCGSLRTAVEVRFLAVVV